MKSGGMFNGRQLRSLGSRRQSTRASEIQSEYTPNLQKKTQEQAGSHLGHPCQDSLYRTTALLYHFFFFIFFSFRSMILVRRERIRFLVFIRRERIRFPF